MPRKRTEKEVRLTVRVPASLLHALDSHASGERNGTGGKSLSRASAARQILENALEDGGRRLKALLLGQLIVNTVKATEHHGATTLATVRELLAGVPKGDLDAALFQLEKEQSLLLTPNHNGDIVTNRERSNALHDPLRGDLLYAQLRPDGRGRR